ncbi:MAG: hypothetical protein AAF478_03610 [Pseudomonadota bacterium]
MKNEQKAVIRRTGKKLKELREEIEHVMTELDEYIHENQDTLDGTERGEKLDDELNAVYELTASFEMLEDEIRDMVG